MTTIIAGRFGQQCAVQRALTTLQSAGFPPAQTTSFYVNPAGQHDQYRVGGDRDESPRAEHSDRGSAIGSGAGAAAIPLTRPVGMTIGALLGAYIGSLVGRMAQTDNAKDMPAVRKSGMLVAVAAINAEEEQRAIDTLRALGASDMERADGQIVDGDWTDFDPLSSPQFVA